eukprot:COSAG06_NODE_19524_length_834_cov_1.620408_1_plen_253_part_01
MAFSYVSTDPLSGAVGIRWDDGTPVAARDVESELDAAMAALQRTLDSRPRELEMLLAQPAHLPSMNAARSARSILDEVELQARLPPLVHDDSLATVRDSVFSPQARWPTARSQTPEPDSPPQNNLQRAATAVTAALALADTPHSSPPGARDLDPEPEELPATGHGARWQRATVGATAAAALAHGARSSAAGARDLDPEPSMVEEDLRQWLHALRLTQYASTIAELGAVLLEHMTYMTDEDVKSINMKPLEERR